MKDKNKLYCALIVRNGELFKSMIKAESPQEAILKGEKCNPNRDIIVSIREVKKNVI